MRGFINRISRKYLAIGILILTLILLPLIVLAVQQRQETRSHAAYTGTDYAKIRQAWFDYKTGGNYDTSNPELNTLIQTKVTAIANSGRTTKDGLNTDPDRTYLFKDKDGKPIYTNGGDGIADTYEKVEKMALAYATKNAITDPTEKEELYKSIKSSLRWLNNNWYNTGKCPGNIYETPLSPTSQCSRSLVYQVNIPRSLTTSVILIYDRLSQDPDFSDFITKNMNAVERFYTNPRDNDSNQFYNGNGVHDTAGNLAMVTIPLLLRAGISKDSIALDEALYNYNQEFMQYTTSVDGLYRDGSFIQHEIHPYNMWYGSIFFRYVTEISRVLSESGLAGANIDKLYRFYKDGYQPFIFNNESMDMVIGRNISSPNISVSSGRAPLVEYEAGIVNLLSGDKYQDLGSDIMTKTKGQVIKDSIFTITQTYKLTKDPNLSTNYNYEITKLFPRMDRFINVKKDYAIGISLSSNRIGNYETIDGVNKKGWYMSDGMFYFYNKTDPGQYNDYYWATVDKTKLPGTTVDNTIKLAANNTYLSDNYDSKFDNYRSPKLNAGGAVLNQYAVVGMNLRSALNVQARKSYFVFDDEVVAIGSGITATNGEGTVTVVDNRKIKDDNSNLFLIDNNPISSGVNLSNPKWAYLEGTGGYYFPSGGDIFAQKQTRRGTWKQLKDDESSDLTPPKNFASIWFKHGVNPTNEKYTYVFLPNKSQADTQTYAQNPDISILSNSVTAHVVKENKINITSANFWEGGSAGGVTSSDTSSIIIDEEPNAINISVADPTQANGIVNFTINKNANSVVSKDTQINVTDTSPIKFSVDMSGSKGRSYKITLATNNPTTTPTNNPTNTPVPTLKPSNTPTPIPTKTPTSLPTPIPTNTPAPTSLPTPTIIIDSFTQIKLSSVKLHGIGKGGDATNPSSLGTTNPLRTTRSVTLEIFNSSGSLVTSATGNVSYSLANGDFTGTVMLPSSISTGSYLVKIKSPQYLKKQFDGIINITRDNTTTLPSIILVVGDVNNDNILSIADFNVIADCYSDLLPAKNCSDVNKKASADLSDDGNVNSADYNLFLRELSIVGGD